MLPSYFDYIFVHLRQKLHLRPDLSPKFLSTLGPNPTQKARSDLQLCFKVTKRFNIKKIVVLNYIYYSVEPKQAFQIQVYFQNTELMVKMWFYKIDVGVHFSRIRPVYTCVKW